MPTKDSTFQQVNGQQMQGAALQRTLPPSALMSLHAMGYIDVPKQAGSGYTQTQMYTSIIHCHAGGY